MVGHQGSNMRMADGESDEEATADESNAIKTYELDQNRRGCLLDAWNGSALAQRAEQGSGADGTSLPWESKAV